MVSVGIVHADKLEFTLHNGYKCCGQSLSGLHTCHLVKADKEMTEEASESSQQYMICYEGKHYDKLVFAPEDDELSYFQLSDVTIGIDFHWERKETLSYRGELHIIIDEGRLCAVNVLPVEDYLLSVISSEMSPTASLEFLKAHAVISRSWLLAQIEARRLHGEGRCCGTCHTDVAADGECSDGQQTIIKWYDTDSHHNFDVCADDHCQRYQGITRVCSLKAKEAIDATRGQVMMYDGEICDARFSKSCGGIMEEFENCWEPDHKPYLIAKRDDESSVSTPCRCESAGGMSEDDARRWILSSPAAFCNTTDRYILSQVLNNYDQETTDFYRWQVDYTQESLSELARRKSGIDFGLITALQPVKRGPSGRIIQLRIVGTNATVIIGKELEIRRTLSESHLFSSAFVVDSYTADDGTLHFLLHGAGWGHGVGLCQIGAAVMGERGYSYDSILKHYYPGMEIKI